MKRLLPALCLALTLLSCGSQFPLRVNNLRTDYIENPVGIDDPQPVLSWMLEAGPLRGVNQTAYELRLYADAAHKQLLHSSGKVDSDQQTDVPLSGLQLTPHTRYHWTVTVWDNQGHSATSAEDAYFETGLMDTGWKGAQWIRTAGSGYGDDDKRQTLLFRQGFEVDKPVDSAKLYASALGVFDLFVNGQRVGHSMPDGSTLYDELKPGWTDYRAEVNYMTYDVTHLLRPGSNVAGAQVSNGWWGGAIAHGVYGDPPLALLCRLHIAYHDGTTQEVITTPDWLCSADGPVRSGDIYNGETYDARRECDWASPAYDASNWTVAAPYDYAGQVTAFRCQPVRIRPALERRPTSITLYNGADDTGTTFGSIHITSTPEPDQPFTLQPGETALVDLGQNMVGWLRFSVKGQAGSTLTARFGEMLNDNGDRSRANDGPGGSLYTFNLRTADATLTYILRGDPEGETYEPTTTFMGFRYCQLTATEAVQIVGLTGRVVGSDIEETGTFHCSHADVNQLFSNIQWGQRGNFLSIPTDCPQRDERLGWTADTQIFSAAASYNAYTRSFYHKWMTDMRHSQRADGAYPDMAPFCNFWGYGNAAWGDAGVIVPWTVYRMFGDRQILRDNYDSMRRYIDWLATQAGGGYQYNGAGTNMGDWLAYDPTDARYVSVTHYAYVARLMSQIATVLSVDEPQADAYQADATAYQQLYNDIRAEFQRRYLDADGLPTIQTQTAYLLALKFDLLPEPARAKAVRRLRQAIVDNNYCLSTGFVGTGILNQTLNDLGLDDLAYDLLLQRRNPSWLYSVDQGATTIWERWDSYTKETGFNKHPWNMNSFNHYAYGAVAEWLYACVAGIAADLDAPGFRHIILQPTPDLRTSLPDGQERITHAEATYRSQYGLIRSAWRLEDDGHISYQATVPPGTTATLRLPVLALTPERQPGSPIPILTYHIYEGGQEVEDAEGVKFLDMEGNKAILELQSGTYEFTIR